MQKTFLGKLFSTDRVFAYILSVILVIYIFIHIFRLEMYPMYMFAMFSKQETPRENYHVYNLYEKDREIDLKCWDYRKYTVLMNTIGQYDDILSNDLNHPEADAIDKLIDRLHLNNTGLKDNLKGSFSFSKPTLDEKMGIWISKNLNIRPQDLKIEKASYSWKDTTPYLKKKVLIYGMDQ